MLNIHMSQFHGNFTQFADKCHRRNCLPNHPKYSPEEEVVNGERLVSPVHFLTNCWWLVLVVHSSRPNIIPFRDSRDIKQPNFIANQPRLNLFKGFCNSNPDTNMIWGEFAYKPASFHPLIWAWVWKTSSWSWQVDVMETKWPNTIV